jgi:transaldolase
MHLFMSGCRWGGTANYLQVNLGLEIASLVSGYVSTEVDPRLSFDTDESLVRARRIIAM